MPRLLLLASAALSLVNYAPSRAAAQAAAKPQAEVGSPTVSERSASETEAAREKIWNSPEMLDARAYLDTYFERSAKISDAQAKRYMEDLRAKNPEDMKIWLLKFQEERGAMRRRNDSARKGRQMSLSNRQPSPSVGGFRNPYSGGRTVSSGLPMSGSRQYFSSQNAGLAPRPTVQKPFSGPQYDRARRPLVTGEDVARWEILRGLGPFGPF